MGREAVLESVQRTKTAIASEIFAIERGGQAVPERERGVALRLWKEFLKREEGAEREEKGKGGKGLGGERGGGRGGGSRRGG